MAVQGRSLFSVTSLDRRTLMKRAGALGLSIPAAGMLANAMGTDTASSLLDATVSFVVP